MKLDLEDGRVLQLPDEMSDESARQLKRLILGNEERARAAEQRAASLEQRLAALEQRPEPQPVDLSPLVDTLHQHHKEHMDGLARLEKFARADRVMMADETGEYTRSRIA